MNTRRFRKSSNRSGLGEGFARVLFVAVLMAMLVLPLTGTRAGAEDNSTINPAISSDQPLVVDNSLTDPAVDPSVVDPDPATPDDNIDLQIQPSLVADTNLTPVVVDPGLYPSDLSINALLCPADLDLWSVDYYGLASGCQGGYANGYELNVHTVNAPVWQQLIQDNVVTIPGIAQDTYTIDFTNPASGGNNLRIICSADDMQGNDAIGYADLTVDQFGGDLYVEGNLQYWCDAFIQMDPPYTPSASGMTVYINKHGCPEGIVSDDEYFLASVCQDSPTGIDFNLTDENGTTTQTTAGTPAMATFSPVDGSTLNFAEVIPAGYDNPAVFCDIEDGSGNDLLQAILNPTVTNGAWTVDQIPVEAYTIFCDVFNFPTDTDGGSIIIVKYECPANYDFSTGDPTADCGQLLNGVQFNANGPNGYASQTDTGDSINGAVFFGGLEAGTYDVAETMPAGFDQAWWWNCTSDTADLSGFTAQDHSDGSAFSYDLADNEDIVCTVYNAPSDHGTVDVHKWECPEAYDQNHDLTWYQTNCTQAMANVEFNLVNNGTNASQLYTTDANGDFSFTTEYGQTYFLYETVPAGFSDPVVYCKWGGYTDDGNGGQIAVDGIVQRVDTPQNEINWDTTYTNFGMDCNWYNNPTDWQSVTVYKYTCPAGYDLSNPQTDCTQLTDDVDFHLLPEGQAQLDGTTGDAGLGTVAFNDVPTGNLKLWEDVPSGTTSAYVTCQWFDANGPYIYQQYPSLTVWDGAPIGNSIDFAVAEHDQVVCQWYNVPDKTWYGGDLTIYKYWCSTSVVSEDACELGAGVKFVVTATDGSSSPILTETGPGGFVDVIGLPAGSYTVSEKDYEWCKAVSTNVDADGNVVVEEGQETILTVFNCTDKPTKNPPVKQFPNTGAGMTSERGTGDELIVLLGMVAVAIGGFGVALRLNRSRMNEAVVQIHE